MCGGSDAVKRVVFPVERTGLVYLSLSKRGGVPIMCVGAVMQ